MSARSRIRFKNFLQFENLSIINYHCVSFQLTSEFISLQWKFINYFRNDKISKNVCKKYSVIAHQHTLSLRSSSSFTADIINTEKKKERTLRFREVLRYLTCEFDFIEVNICITSSFFDCVAKYMHIEFIITLLQLLDDYLLIFLVCFIQFEMILLMSWVKNEKLFSFTW